MSNRIRRESIEERRGCHALSPCSRLGGNRLEDLLQPPDVYPDIIGEFWVKTRAHDIALPDRHNIIELSSLDLGSGRVERAAFLALCGPIRQHTENLDAGLVRVVVLVLAHHHHTRFHGGYRRLMTLSSCTSSCTVHLGTLVRCLLMLLPTTTTTTIDKQQLLDNGRPDKDAGKGGRGVRGREDVGLGQKGEVDIGDKGLDLAAKVVAVDADR